MARIRGVRKRDNRVVPYDPAKVSDAIYRAMLSVGNGDRALAQDLGEAVTLFLEKRCEGEIPQIEDIQDMVETVLIEMGHAEVAKAYILYRNRKTRIRESLQVRKQGPEGAATPEVDPGSRDRLESWSRGKIVAALIREADVEADAAEEIASAVERKVLRSGLRRISTGLIRELVDNELLERGFAATLSRQAPIGIPRYNLEQIIFGADRKEGFSFPKGATEIDALISGHILHQYSLAETHSPEVGYAHREGRIHVHRLGDPLRIWAGRIPGETASALAASDRDRLVRLAGSVSEELVLTDPPAGGIEGVVGLLASGVAREARLRIEVDLSDEGPAERAGEVAERLAGADVRWLVRVGPETFRTKAARRALAVFAARYASGGDVRFALPAVLARDGAPLTAAKITLNLPQLAYRSGQDPQGGVEGEIDRAIDLAVKAAMERRHLLSRLGRGPELPLWGVLGAGEPLFDLDRARFAIGILGLSECVRYLSGEEAYRAEAAAAFARDVVDHIAHKLGRERRGLAIEVEGEETQAAGGCERFATIDRKRFPCAREVFRARRGDPAYSDGVRLPRDAPVDPLRRNEYLAGFVGTVAIGGIVEDVSGLRPADAEILSALLEESVGMLPVAATTGAPDGGV
ncbi:MAG: hypothetical protein JXP34_18620 [Planctomycetes bacterium]|nr:hypothetical protein [Planctomycetota bacterium]